jgi:hypothetical protein
MVWKRKATRYRWGATKENELRKILGSLLRANCRSSRSGGLLDVWSIGKYAYLFQVKRGVLSIGQARRLLVELHDAIPNPTAFIWVAHWTPERKWKFYYLRGKMNAS